MAHTRRHEGPTFLASQRSQKAASALTATCSAGHTAQASRREATPKSSPVLKGEKSPEHQSQQRPWPLRSKQSQGFSSPSPGHAGTCVECIPGN